MDYSGLQPPLCLTSRLNIPKLLNLFVKSSVPPLTSKTKCVWLFGGLRPAATVNITSGVEAADADRPC